jgi:hypothetical protein
MVSISALWLPILVSAVLVFLASSVIHMLLPYHKSDYSRLPGEDGVRAAMRKEKPAPGDYVVPYASSMKELGSPEMLEKYKEGPVGFLTVVPDGPPAMNKALGLWFVYLLAGSFVVAYVVSRTLVPDTHYLEVFRVAGTAAFLCYAGAQPMNSIWSGRKWSTTVKNVLDGLVYALLTAGVFGWLWPR